MATRDHIAVGNLSSPGAGDNDLTVASLGWTPTAVMVVITRTATGALKQGASRLIAVADSNDNWATLCVGGDSGVATSDTWRQFTTSPTVLSLYKPNGAYDASYHINSGHATAGPIADGWRMNVSDTSGWSTEVDFILFGGTGLEAIVQGFVANATEDASTTITTGFETSFGIVASTGGASSGSVVTHDILSLGAFSGTTEQAALLHSSPDAESTTVNSQLVMTNGVCGQLHAGVLDWRGEVTAIDATTVEITTRDGGSFSDEGFLLAIKLPTGIGTKAEIVDAPTSAASDWSHTGAGLTPDFAMLFTSMIDAIDTIDTAAVFSTGIASHDGTSSTFSGVQNEDNVATTNVTCWQALQWIDHYDSTSANKFDIDPASSPFTSDGWTVDAADIAAADGTARKWLALSVGAQATFVPAPRRSMVAGIQSLSGGGIN